MFFLSFFINLLMSFVYFLCTLVDFFLFSVINDIVVCLSKSGMQVSFLQSICGTAFSVELLKG